MKGRINAGALVVDLAYTYTVTEQISQITNAGVDKGKYTYTTNGFSKTVEVNGKTLQYTHDGMGNILKTENLTTSKVKDEFTYIGDTRISECKEYDDTNGNLLGTTSFVFNESGNLSQSLRTEAGTNKRMEGSGRNNTGWRKKSSNFRVKTLSEAKALLKEARGNMNRVKEYRKYSPEPGKHYKVHPEESGTQRA